MRKPRGWSSISRLSQRKGQNSQFSFKVKCAARPARQKRLSGHQPEPSELAIGLKLNELLLRQRAVGDRRYHDRATPLTALAQLDRAVVEPAGIGLISVWSFSQSGLAEQGRNGEARAQIDPQRPSTG